MAKKVDANRAQSQLLADIKHLFKLKGIDPLQDEFTVIQPYADNEAIIVSVSNEGKERKLDIKINDLTLVLPKKEESLDIFEEKTR